MGWSIRPSGSTFATIDENGHVTFAPQDFNTTYTITYTDSAGCSATTNFMVKSCPPVPPSEECEGYSFEMQGGSSKPLIQAYSGSGGTPIQIHVKDNNMPVTGLTEEDFIFTIGNDGSANEIMVGMEFVEAIPGMYVIRMIKADADITCKYIGDILPTTVHLRNCENAQVQFYITIAEYNTYKISIQGAPSDMSSLYIGFTGKIGECEHYVHMGEVQAVKDRSSGLLTANIDIYKDFDFFSPDTKIVLANAGSYCQSPQCAKVIDVRYPNINVLYCPNGSCR